MQSYFDAFETQLRDELILSSQASMATQDTTVNPFSQLDAHSIHLSFQNESNIQK